MSQNIPRGLTSKEVKESRQLYGENIITRQNTHGFLAALGSSFQDPIIRILLVALTVNLIITFNGGGWFESVGIVVAILLSTIVSTLSEYSSETAFNRMREEASKQDCRVIRNGKIQKIPVSEIVVGDAVMLSAGEKIPADGNMLSGEVAVDQSSLNGESRETVKRNEESKEKGLHSFKNVFCGSFVLSGQGIMTVTRVGDGTIYGKTALETAEDTRESPMRMRLGHLAGTLSKLGLVSAALIAAVDLFKAFVMDNGFELSAILSSFNDLSSVTQKLIHAIILAVTVVVVAVPEGLPMMITVVLSSNTVSMLKDGVLVRKPVGIETAGSMNILFTDKTGTLTSGRLSLVSVIDGGGEMWDADKLNKDTKLYELLTLSSVYNSSCSLSENKISGGDFTERALLNGVLPLCKNYKRRTVTQRLPFSSDRKYSAVTLNDGQTFVKGAPEIILSACAYSMLPNGERVPLPASRLKSKMNLAASKTLRIIAVALSDTPVTQSDPPKNLTLVCLACIRDALRSKTKKAVGELKRAGIQTVMLTGDNKITATAVANEAGITELTDGVYDASVIRAMSDRELRSLLPKIKVISRSLPSDKSRLVSVAQSAGMVVGMTGDGVNDAPALKKADVGFAMGSGSEIAKDAGDIVILNDDLASISRAVLYGRTVFKSIRKFIIFQLTMNFCAVGISLLGPLLGVEMPITVIQMLWVNIIMDSFAGLAFAGEPPDARRMTEPPKPRNASILTRRMLVQITDLVGRIVLLCVGFLALPQVRVWFPTEREWLTGFFALFVFCGVAGAFCARTEGPNLLRGLTRNPSFWGIMLAVTAVQLGLLYLGGDLFRTHGLTPTQLGITALAALSLFPTDMLGKALRSHWKSFTIGARTSQRRTAL